jgi:hypothetical protein
LARKKLGQLGSTRVSFVFVDHGRARKALQNIRVVPNGRLDVEPIRFCEDVASTDMNDQFIVRRRLNAVELENRQHVSLRQASQLLTRRILGAETLEKEEWIAQVRFRRYDIGQRLHGDGGRRKKFMRGKLDTVEPVRYREEDASSNLHDVVAGSTEPAIDSATRHLVES